MSDIEKYIKNNKDQFTQDHPSSNHLKSFEQKLIIEHSPFKRFYHNYKYAVSIAATFLIIISIGIGVLKMNNNDFVEIVSRQMQVFGISDEVQEVITYYTFQVEDQLAMIDKYANSKDEAKRIKKMAKDQIKLLDIRSMALQNELELNGEDQRVKDALINNHKVRKEFLDNVINQLKNNNL